MQCSSTNGPQKYVYDQLHRFTGDDWLYIHFNDDERIKYLSTYAIHEFPNIIEKYNSLFNIPHRVDLFRYYFLYKNGGVYLDSDAMLYRDINHYVEKYNFFSVESPFEWNLRGQLWNGFIGSTANHEIIKNALFDFIFNIDNDQITQDFHISCARLYNFVQNTTDKNIKLFFESSLEGYFASGTFDESISKENLIACHYYKFKDIPYNGLHPSLI